MSKKGYYSISLVMAVFMLFCIFVSPVSAESFGIVSTGSADIDSPGNCVNITITLNQTTDGFSGYNVYLDVGSSSVAEVTAVYYPSWAVLNNVSSLPATDDILLKACDLNDMVQAGATNVELATLTINGLSVGTTDFVFTGQNFDNESGGNINISFTSGSVTVGYPAPSISCIPSNVFYNVGSYNVTIWGTEFRDGMTAVLHKENCTNISCTDISLPNYYSMRCSLNLTGATPGNWSLTVTNTDGKSDTVESMFKISELPVITIEGQSQMPTDPNSDGLYEDLNGNSDIDYADVNLFFDKLDWMRANEPVSAFDFVSNGDLAIGDIIALFDMIS